MNPRLKAIILEYRDYLNEKKRKAQTASFSLREMNTHLLKPSRIYKTY